MPYLVHHNIKIKNEVIKYYESLINYLSPEVVFSNLYHPLSEYLNITPLFLYKNIISNYSVERSNRLTYQLDFRRGKEIMATLKKMGIKNYLE